MSDAVDELAIARKARAAADELADLRAQNARLVELLDVLRAQSAGIAETPRPHAEQKCYRCAAVYVDNKRRVVECQRCGAELDPIEVLHEFAVRERRFLASNDLAKRELARLHAEIEALKGDLQAARRPPTRVECPRGCGKFVAASDVHPRGVAPHACYAARAKRHLVPRVIQERWRVVTDAGAGRWTDMVTATRAAAVTAGARVEEYLGPIGDAAERATERRALERR